MTADVAWRPDWRTFTIGSICLHTNRTSPDAPPIFMIYPLTGKRGVLIKVWRRNFDFRWQHEEHQR